MSKQHTAWSIVFALVILLVLAVMPAQAQDIGGAVQSDALYLPQIAWTFPMWFTIDELSQAQADAGYDVDEAQMHTNCTLDVTAVPPYLYRFSECKQYFILGVGPTEGTDHYILWLKLNDGKVHSIEVGGTMVQSAGTDAPCYVEDDGEVVCG